MKRPIELLSPARNLECGIAAIDCGADAIYIGASDFGARAEATNSLEDISTLVNYAHFYGVKVYVTLNTILYDSELKQARELALSLAEIGVDALIVQDTALLEMNLPIPLHASTQMDCQSAEKANFLSQVGFKRIVLARELCLQEIKEIHQSCSAELEVFVHGALCVSYSGQCYASQYCFNRSANRGQCAQFCRLPFDLIDETGKIVCTDKHLLSLKDMNRIQSLEEIMDAGATSFKIEGRLKNANYVKNITAAYRKQIDLILTKRKDDYQRSSFGTAHIDFNPQPAKSFNRGFTDYFLHGQQNNFSSIHTPKSIGEMVGTVKELRGKTLKVAGICSFSSGDGLCYFDDLGKLQGFRVNKVENGLLILAEKPAGLRPNARLYRNLDAAFEKQLLKKTPQRTIALDLVLKETSQGYSLSFTDETGRNHTEALICDKQIAQKPQKERIIAELSKLGGTPFHCRNIFLQLSQSPFIPASFLSNLRRRGIDAILSKPIPQQHPYFSKPIHHSALSIDYLTYRANIANEQARVFYARQGATHIAPAFELCQPQEPLLMVCKHCIRYTLGLCSKNGGKKNTHKELYLVMQSGQKFRLKFNCHQCQMEIYASNPSNLNTIKYEPY